MNKVSFILLSLIMRCRRRERAVGTFRRFQRRCLEEFWRDYLPLCQSCKNNSVQIVVSKRLCHDSCFSQYSFISTRPISWCGRGTSEVCRTCLTPCDGVVLFVWLPQGISCQQGRLSVFLFSFRVGEGEEECVLHSLLLTPWSPLQQLREKVPAAK